MNRLLALLPFALLVGCSASSEDASTASSNLDETTNVAEPAAEPTATLSQQAEARWQEIEKEKTMLAGSVVAVQIDDGPVTLMAEDEVEAEVPGATGAFFFLNTSGAIELHINSKTPGSAPTPGTLQCAANNGKMKLKIDGEAMLSDPAKCSLTFERSYDETFPPGFVSGVVPQKLHVGSFEATVSGASGATHVVKVGFLVTELR